MEAFFDRWARFLWSFVTPGRIRRSVVVGAITAIIAFTAGYGFLPPQPRWTWNHNSYRQYLVGFSPGGRWLAVAGYRGDPQNEVLWIWDLKNGSSEPRHTVVLPWSTETGHHLNRKYQNGSIFQWSPDDRELLYVAPAIYTIGAAIHFVNLETGTETEPPWPLTDLVWQQPWPTSDGIPQRPLPVDWVEFSPRGRWLLLRRRRPLPDYPEGVAVADRHTRNILFALGNVVNAVMQADDRHLLVQEFSSDSWEIRNQAINWIDYDLVTGERTELKPALVPQVEDVAPIVDFDETTSRDRSRWARMIPYVPNRPRISRLQLFDLPLRPPWEWILVDSLGAALAVIVLMELGIGWRRGFEVNEVREPNQDD